MLAITGVVISRKKIDSLKKLEKRLVSREIPATERTSCKHYHKHKNYKYCPECGVRIRITKTPKLPEVFCDVTVGYDDNFYKGEIDLSRINNYRRGYRCTNDERYYENFHCVKCSSKCARSRFDDCTCFKKDIDTGFLCDDCDQDYSTCNCEYECYEDCYANCHEDYPKNIRGYTLECGYDLIYCRELCEFLIYYDSKFITDGSSTKNNDRIISDIELTDELIEFRNKTKPFCEKLGIPYLLKIDFIMLSD